MPITFIDIERRKSWRIAALFCLLILLYFLATLALVQGILFFFMPFGSRGLTLERLLIIFCSSLAIGGLHFFLSGATAVQYVVEALDARQPDREDGVHRRLMNVAAEVEVATGGKRKIECVVIPSLSMNALAVTDLRGRAVIAVSEGLLSRLTRPQLEAVISHEAYHILSGDCLESSLATSLFGMYASFLERMQRVGEDEAPVGFHPAFLLFWLLLRLSELLNLFISREREYRADAASLRMTRNPVAMAEALYLLARNWSGTGVISAGLEMLCIVPPLSGRFDEEDGIMANLLSTHPPIMKRIEVLLRMARVGIADLSMRMERADLPAAADEDPAYYLLNDTNLWEGPFRPDELLLVPWLSPSTWISAGKAGAAMKASDDPQVSGMIGSREGAGDSGDRVCPECRQPLSTVSYEMTQVHRCAHCRGTLVDNSRIPRIVARREVGCTERLQAIAAALVRDNQRRLAIRRLRQDLRTRKPLLLCGSCGNRMMRKFYSLAYLIEVDVCGRCGTTWFEKDELEMLQCVIDHRILPRVEPDYV